MRAVRVRAPDEVGVDEVSTPGTDAGQALIAMERAGVCGTDLHILHGGVPVDYPLILGHELVGRVSQPGDSGTVAEGTRVLINPSVACGRCRQCRADRPNLCPNGALMGRDVDGGFAEAIAVDENQLHPIPESVPAEHSAMLQVLGVCVHAQRSVEVFPGQTAVVIGLGVSGLLMVQLLQARGIDRVVGVTRSASKRRLAEQLGATVTATPDEARETIERFTDGVGADVVFECVGSVGTFAQAIESAGLGGTVVLFGTSTATEGSLPFYQLYYKELTLRNPRAALPRDYDTAVELLASGRVRVAEMLSEAYPLERAHEAFEALTSRSGLLKVTLEVG